MFLRLLQLVLLQMEKLVELFPSLFTFLLIKVY